MRTSAGTGARVEFPSVLFLSCAAYRKTKVIANPPPVLGFRGTAIALVQRVIAANFRSRGPWHSKQTFYLRLPQEKSRTLTETEVLNGIHSVLKLCPLRLG